MQSRQAKKPTHVPEQGMFEEPLVVQSKNKENSQQPDWKTLLRRAERYGHHLRQMPSTGFQSSRTVQLQKGNKKNPENKTPDKTLSQADEEWEKAWKAKQLEVQQAMQAFVPQFQALDPNAEVHIKGSLASGVKLNPKKRSPTGEPYVFNPTDFDIDAYVKSDKLYEQAIRNGAEARKAGEIVGSKSRIRAFNEIIKTMREKLAEISGNRDVGEEMYKFNVFIRTQKNVASSIKRDQDLAKKIGRNPSIGNPLIIPEPEK
ncbi:hypothetical protein NIES4103_29130 [Nostoc sp. NIES-4103]|nr:hypothetical protein NIES4103_29130 [Nostoc sp. NIES-4103]